MIAAIKKYFYKGATSPVIKETGVVEAYDLWAANYDMQPGNLMLDLDKAVFNDLLKNVDIAGKSVADIGCGTGRHWPDILSRNPASITGFDVSAGMLAKLKEKYHSAHVYEITDNYFSTVPDSSCDIIISTLTIAHIENIENALKSWCRILKSNGDLIITDFHPDALASGGQRTFNHNNTPIAVKNFVYSTSFIKKLLSANGLVAIEEGEREVDESVKVYYQKQNALHVYEKFKGFKMIYGIRFMKI